jgi:hypothetical protein
VVRFNPATLPDCGIFAAPACGRVEALLKAADGIGQSCFYIPRLAWVGISSHLGHSSQLRDALDGLVANLRY